jgi:hypothetical protein
MTPQLIPQMVKCGKYDILSGEPIWNKSSATGDVISQQTDPHQLGDGRKCDATCAGAGAAFLLATPINLAAFERVIGPPRSVVNILMRCHLSSESTQTTPQIQHQTL